MDRIWQWAWDRYGARYSWAIWVGVFASTLPPYLLWSFLVVACEKSSHYVEAAVVTGGAVVVMSLVVVLPGSRRFRLAQRWAAGDEVDRAEALQDMYIWSRAVGVSRHRIVESDDAHPTPLRRRAITPATPLVRPHRRQRLHTYV